MTVPNIGPQPEFIRRPIIRDMQPGYLADRREAKICEGVRMPPAVYSFVVLCTRNAPLQSWLRPLSRQTSGTVGGSALGVFGLACLMVLVVLISRCGAASLGL